MSVTLSKYTIANHEAILTSDPPTFKVGLTPEEKKLYAQLFKLLDPDNTGIITGEKARLTFEKSGLPPPILGEIWQIADQNNLGFLSQFGFCLAMRLIGYTQAGQHPTASLADNPGPLPKFANLHPQAPLQPQSTNSSFMQSQPLSLIPQNTATLLSKPQDPISQVTPMDYQRFSSLFAKTVGSPSGELEGSQARDIFMKAKLPTPTLGQIWSLVDRYNVGKLNVDAFVIAMHLIQNLLSGQINQLPPFLPESIWQSVLQQHQGATLPGAPQVAPQSPSRVSSRQLSHSSVNSQLTTVRHSRDSYVAPPADEWVVTPTMKQQYDSIFANLDKAKKGELNPDQVASFLMTSKLKQEDLAAVWDLADIHNLGIFTRFEFSIALALVNKRLAGGELPNVVPDALLASLKDSQLQLQQPAQQQPVQPVQPQPVQPVQPQPVQPSSLQVSQSSASAPKSSIDDLVDIFGSPEPRTAPERVASSSDLTPSDLPKVRGGVFPSESGSFTPTSSFGQNLMKNQTQPAPLGSPTRSTSHRASTQPRVSTPLRESVSEEPESTDQSQKTSQQNDVQKSVNYDALRSVPPPPPKKQVTTDAVPEAQPRSQQGDLLADPETAGQLSQANIDIANVSNQIKSLATQTTGLHEKKLRSEQELQKILSVKAEIENKLKQLRTSYENEVKQVDQVEGNLATAREETEALRSEASISEAKFNALSTELNEKQVAMEELQKQNSALKEKLGYLNAEIVELEKQVEAKTAENHQFSNQVNVKKSQVQVSLVKSQELKKQLADLEALNNSHHTELTNAHNEHSRLTEEHESLTQNFAAQQARQQELKQQRALLEKKQRELQEKRDAHQRQVEQHKQVEPEVEQAHPSEQTALRGLSEGTSSHTIPGGLAVGAAAGAAIGAAGAAISNATHGSEETVTPKNANLEAEQETKEPSDEMSKEFTEDNFKAHNRSSAPTNSSYTGTTSSVVTDIDEETPGTLPSNSDVQFPQQNQGIVGGLVGMPGVLVGVQRSDSLTSSVQNNAALSVRDDNIEVSDRETLGEIEHPKSEGTFNEDRDADAFEEERAEFERGPRQDGFENPPAIRSSSADGDKLSSGVESFEMVNADDANEDPRPAAKNPPRPEEDEFPPIKELNYEESSSDDDSSDNFDDAEENLRKSGPGLDEERVPAHKASTEPHPVDNQAESRAPAGAPKNAFDFDSAFDDLAPAQPEPRNNDLFGGDEFAGLEAAKVEHGGFDDYPTGNEDFGFNEGFTSNAQPQAPDFHSEAPKEEENDEWEQLFAGFGNAPKAAPGAPVSEPAQAPVPGPEPVAKNDDSVDELVEELEGMGFSKLVSYDALKKHRWDLQEAINYLLDNA